MWKQRARVSLYGCDVKHNNNNNNYDNNNNNKDNNNTLQKLTE